MPKPKLPPEPKPVAWRIEIDFDSASVNPGSASKKKAVYVNKGGMTQLIDNALSQGVHPSHIHIEKVYGEWVPDGTVLAVCPKCKVSFDEPSDNCEYQRRAKDTNARREHGRELERGRTNGNQRFLLPDVKLPHPEPLVIEEQEL